jgi:hypothetical protein
MSPHGLSAHQSREYVRHLAVTLGPFAAENEEAVVVKGPAESVCDDAQLLPTECRDRHRPSADQRPSRQGRLDINRSPVTGTALPPNLLAGTNH